MQILTVFITQHNVRCVIAQAVFINLGRILIRSYGPQGKSFLTMI